MTLLLAPSRLAGQRLLRTQPDARLLDLAQAGSRPAFEAIVARYRRQLLRYCARLVSEEHADDAVQQTFVKAYAAFENGEVVRTLRPWLYRIAHNTALNLVRDRALRHEALDERVGSPGGPEEVAEVRERLNSLVGSLQALPGRQRDAILLREFEGRSYDEIARELGVSGGAVRQLLSRARVDPRERHRPLAGRLPPTPQGRRRAGRRAGRRALRNGGRRDGHHEGMRPHAGNRSGRRRRPGSPADG